MQEIAIGGKSRPIVFGMSTVGAFCSEKRIPLTRMNDAFTHMTLLDTMDLIYHALVAGARMCRIDVEFDKIDVYNWIDENPDAFTEGMRLFGESQPVQGAPAPDKKKAGKGA